MNSLSKNHLTKEKLAYFLADEVSKGLETESGCENVFTKIDSPIHEWVDYVKYDRNIADARKFYIRLAKKIINKFTKEKPITEKYLISKGFVYERFRAGGQDSWAGMDIWTLKTGTGQFITLRGNPGLLKFAGYYDSDIQTEEELDFLIKLLTRKS